MKNEVRQEGGRAATLTRAGVLVATACGGISALAYDMEPGDASAVDFVRQVHAARPDWPVWLYYPPRAAVVERVTEVASLRGLWATSQLASPQYHAEVHAHVRQLLASTPRVRLLYLLDTVLRPLPVEVRGFLEVGLERRDHGEARGFSVRKAAAGFPGHLRHLERACHAVMLPGPKRLADHLLLVFVTFKTFAFHVPQPSAADQVGLAPKDFNRLRRRVLGADAACAELQPQAQFEFALMALANACNVPQQRAEEIARQVIREHLA